MAWPDIVIGAVLLFGALKGFKRGFIGELTGFVALAAGLVAGFVYPGSWDDAVKNWMHLGPGSAHVVAMILYGALIYALVFAAGAVLSRVAKLPILGIGNAVLGAGIGLVKAALLVWAIIYIGLFFPLTKDLRDDLHQSRFVALAQLPDDALDGELRKSLPWFMQPFAGAMFARHHV
ncbi:MAG TPA: CvpA family protein [Candidatus Baltobacteraceae bacterium]|nr:CvpA family protein [Candidatus Baltobacteraceae bacterium]